MRQAWALLRLLLDPRVTRVPARVLRELGARGKRRLPAGVSRDLSGALGRLKRLSFLRRWLDGERLTRHDGRWVLNSFLPPFPGRAYDRMFENLLSGRRLSPVSAYLAITAECPYDCWHCSLSGRRGGSLGEEAWRSIIAGLHGLGASVIGFTGGEPLARPDLPGLVEAAVAGGAETVVFTSGAGMTSERASALKRAGLWAFCVSLDTIDPAECGRLRGDDGAYGAALEALRMARRSGFYTMIGAVATRPFVEGRLYEGLYRLARAEGVRELRLVEPMPCGKLSGAGQDEHLLEPRHTEELKRFHVETNRAGRGPKVCAFNRVEGPELFGCGAGTQHLFIDPAGEVCPCDFTPMSFGNAAREPLALIWERMTAAFGAPRRRCFIQTHHGLLDKHAEGGVPLPLEASLRVCAEAGREPLPDYFKMVIGEE